MRALFEATIWCPGAIPRSEVKYAGPLKWFVFPLFDVLMAIIGGRTLYVGMPSIDAQFPSGVAWTLSLIWLVVAVICLIGAVFPELWPFEIGGKVALFIILAIYLIALRTAPSSTEGARDAVSLLTVAAMLIPLLRLWILGIEIRDRKES
jgi:hypothetical protein